MYKISAAYVILTFMFVGFFCGWLSVLPRPSPSQLPLHVLIKALQCHTLHFILAAAGTLQQLQKLEHTDSKWHSRIQ